MAVGDYDNDGDPDVYITAIGGGHLFRNDGKGHFEDVTEAANAKGSDGWLTGAAFLDIDNDGDLDLFLCNYVDLDARDRQGPGLPAHRAGPCLRPADLVQRARSAACCATTAAGSPTSARSRASRSARPT